MCSRVRLQPQPTLTSQSLPTRAVAWLEQQRPHAQLSQQSNQGGNAGNHTASTALGQCKPMPCIRTESKHQPPHIPPEGPQFSRAAPPQLKLDSYSFDACSLQHDTSQQQLRNNCTGVRTCHTCQQNTGAAVQHVHTAAVATKQSQCAANKLHLTPAAWTAAISHRTASCCQRPQSAQQHQ